MNWLLSRSEPVVFTFEVVAGVGLLLKKNVTVRALTRGLGSGVISSDKDALERYSVVSFVNKRVVIVLAVVAVAVAPDRGEACSRAAVLPWAVPVEPRALVVNADAAFVGTLLRVRPLSVTPVASDVPGLTVVEVSPERVFTFRVEERFKGGLGQKVEVIDSGSSCGLNPTLGRRVGVLLERRDEQVAGTELGVEARERLRP